MKQWMRVGERKRAAGDRPAALDLARLASPIAAHVRACEASLGRHIVPRKGLTRMRDFAIAERAVPPETRQD